MLWGRASTSSRRHYNQMQVLWFSPPHLLSGDRRPSGIEGLQSEMDCTDDTVPLFGNITMKSPALTSRGVSRGTRLTSTLCSWMSKSHSIFTLTRHPQDQASLAKLYYTWTEVWQKLRHTTVSLHIHIARLTRWIDFALTTWVHMDCSEL